MAYQGYLIKVGGDYEIPLTYISLASYKCTYSTLDLDSHRNGNGVLCRNAILKVPHCTFETRKLSNTEIGGLWSAIQSRYTSAIENKVTASVYVTETDSYYTGSFYIPDIEMTIYEIEESTGKILYAPITFEFIGYGEA